MARIKIGILGIAGRMGQAIIQAVLLKPHLELVGGTVRNSADFIKQTKLNDTKIDYFVTDNINILAEKSDVLIDFSNHTSLKNNLLAALGNIKPIVIGTTGFNKDIENLMKEFSLHIPILQSGNMSLGVNLLAKLVKKTASILDNHWDIEISESHHRYKIDSPSGTAIMLGKAAAEGRNVDFKTYAKLSREGIGNPRATGEIGFSSLRAGSIIGDHSVLFAHDSEMITLSHKAQDRSIFANGAVYAAEKLITMPAGFYTMQDILPVLS